uniref:Uncharacterized protein n=1 Tax=Magallana gigas TaxID=29159 RepID=K1R6N8_MAGGI
MVLRFVFTVVCLIGGLHDVISRQGCCGPKQWTGVAIQKLGRYDHDLDVASLADISTNVAYDYVAKKISLQQKIHNITTDNTDLVHVIYDFKQLQNGDKKDLYPDFEYDKKPRLGPNFMN